MAHKSKGIKIFAKIYTPRVYGEPLPNLRIYESAQADKLLHFRIYELTHLRIYALPNFRIYELSHFQSVSLRGKLFVPQMKSLELK